MYLYLVSGETCTIWTPKGLTKLDLLRSDTALVERLRRDHKMAQDAAIRLVRELRACW
jgi:hypothetical protein